MFSTCACLTTSVSLSRIVSLSLFASVSPLRRFILRLQPAFLLGVCLGSLPPLAIYAVSSLPPAACVYLLRLSAVVVSIFVFVSFYISSSMFACLTVYDGPWVGIIPVNFSFTLHSAQAKSVTCDFGVDSHSHLSQLLRLSYHWLVVPIAAPEWSWWPEGQESVNVCVAVSHSHAWPNQRSNKI